MKNIIISKVEVNSDESIAQIMMTLAKYCKYAEVEVKEVPDEH